MPRSTKTAQKLSGKAKASRITTKKTVKSTTPTKPSRVVKKNTPAGVKKLLLSSRIVSGQSRSTRTSSRRSPRSSPRRSGDTMSTPRINTNGLNGEGQPSSIQAQQQHASNQTPRSVRLPPLPATTQIPHPVFGTVTVQWRKAPRPMDGWMIPPRSKINYSNQLFKHNKDELVPGIIISANHYGEDFNQSSGGRAASGRRSSVPGAGAKTANMHSKQRPMVILRRFCDHYIALPLFTYNHQGLQHKSQDFSNEHMSVLDRGTRETFEPQNQHPFLEIEFMARGREIDATSTVRFTYPISMHYTQYCSIEGYLTRDSLITLEKHAYHALCNRDFMPTEPEWQHAVSAQMDAEAAAMQSRMMTMTPQTPLDSRGGDYQVQSGMLQQARA